MKSFLFAFVSSLLPVSGAVVIYAPPEPILLHQGDPSDVRYDLNGDGRMDIQISGYNTMFTSVGMIGTNRYLAIPAVWPDLGGYPVPLAQGVILGGDAVPGSGFAWLSTDVVDGFVSEDEIGQNGAILALALSSGISGTFYPGDEPLRAFFGVEFQSEAGTHYGYLDLYMPAYSIGGYIMGWAYESEPGVPIVTTFIPEPSVPMFTMLCGAGFLVRRRGSRP
jgi:hypothetical protein